MAKRKVYTSEELNLYDKLHTEVIQQRRGTSINVLYLIKETPKYYISLNDDYESFWETSYEDMADYCL